MTRGLPPSAMAMALACLALAMAWLADDAAVRAAHALHAHILMAAALVCIAVERRA